MFSIGKKGSTGAILASAAIILMLFVINSSLNITQQNEILLHMQASRETSLKTENAIWMLDNATTRAILSNQEVSTCNNIATSENFADGFKSTRNKFSCEIMSINVNNNGNNVDVAGTLICTTTLDGFVVNDIRPFEFYKTTGTDGSGNCTVADRVT